MATSVFTPDELVKISRDYILKTCKELSAEYKEASQKDTFDWMKGFHEGKASAFASVAEWIEDGIKEAEAFPYLS